MTWLEFALDMDHLEAQMWKLLLPLERERERDFEILQLFKEIKILFISLKVKWQCMWLAIANHTRQFWIWTNTKRNEILQRDKVSQKFTNICYLKIFGVTMISIFVMFIVVENLYVILVYSVTWYSCHCGDFSNNTSSEWVY